MPGVRRPVSEESREAELAARFTRGHLAHRPINRTDAVSFDMAAESGTERRAGRTIEPLRLESFGRESSRVADVRDQIPNLVSGRRHVNCRRTFHGLIQTHRRL